MRCTVVSAQTSSTRVSDGFEARVEKRTKDTFAPPGGKKLVIFIDDFNMPEKEIFGAQPPLEILRQWMQYEFWYDLKKQTAKRIVDTKVVAGMVAVMGSLAAADLRFNQLDDAAKQMLRDSW